MDAALAARLLADQHPALAAMRIHPAGGVGTVNRVLRLGDRHALRFLRTDTGERELARGGCRATTARAAAARHPGTVATGLAARGYPHPWAVYDRIDGETWERIGGAEKEQAARDLAASVRALHALLSARCCGN